MKTITPVYVSESASRQIVFYKRNGYMKTKSKNRRMSDTESRHVLELTSLAYNFVNLDQPLESGSTMLEQVAAPVSDPEILAFGQRVDEAMNAAGISLLGREALIGASFYNETVNQIAERMGVTPSKIKSEKRKALRAARANQEQFMAGIV
jgi:DNA-directed RNA polymerase specialized sigma24 family protein